MGSSAAKSCRLPTCERMHVSSNRRRSVHSGQGTHLAFHAQSACLRSSSIRSSPPARGQRRVVPTGHEVAGRRSQLGPGTADVPPRILIRSVRQTGLRSRGRGSTPWSWWICLSVMFSSAPVRHADARLTKTHPRTRDGSSSSTVPFVALWLVACFPVVRHRDTNSSWSGILLARSLSARG